MELNASARALIGAGAEATLVTLNPDGSPQVSVVWMALQKGPDLARTLLGPGAAFPPPDAPPGFLTRIRIDKVGGIGPWAS
ncbi:hypothetical protein [Nocardia sienata]|uniref:hypothetical protein n=1 Tax=Nocardia sienata TaxID=248552 RepID=UPI0007A53C75|nr:hypothetical protein [Nocardia sienata]